VEHGKRTKNTEKKQKYERKPGTKTNRKRREVKRQQIEKEQESQRGVQMFFFWVLVLPNNQPAIATTHCFRNHVFFWLATVFLVAAVSSK
jgi:hypothetical protein